MTLSSPLRPPAEEMVAVDGIRFRVRTWSPPRQRRTPSTVFLAGVGGTAEDFGTIADSLRSDRKVFAVDLPGCGGSERRGPYDPIRVADRVAGLVLHLTEESTGDRRVDLVGQGMGGNVAIAVAGSRPDLVRRLVVINAPYRTRHIPWPRHRPTFHRHLMTGSSRAREANVLIGWLRGHLATYRVLPDVAVERVLSVWGTEDRWLAPATAAAVLHDLAQGTSDVRQVTVRAAGHRPHLSDPAATCSAIVEFLRAE